MCETKTRALRASKASTTSLFCSCESLRHSCDDYNQLVSCRERNRMMFAPTVTPPDELGAIHIKVKVQLEVRVLTKKLARS